MSIATQIQRLQTAKADIKTAIENKGVTIPSNATIDAYPTYVSQITSGDGGSDYEQQFIDLIEGDITTLNIPSGTTKIGSYAFYYNNSLKEVTVPNNVTYIGSYAFYHCDKLISIIIPDSVLTISTSVFTSCSGLTEVTIGNGVTSIGNYTFQNCSNLISVTVQATTPPIIFSSIFLNSAKEMKIYVPAESVELYKSASNWNKYADYIEPISE